jgi:hypothetical protein
MHEITLTIDDEHLRNIVIDDLKESYYLAYSSNMTLEEDIKDRKKILKSLKSVIRYYTSHAEYKEWKNEIAGRMVK